MKKELRRGLKNWIELDQKEIKHNYNVFRSLIGPTVRLMAVIKSNAYGHNLFDYAHEMQKLGANYLGVDSIVEAVALRDDGVTMPIFVLDYTLPELYAQAVAHNIEISVSNFDYFKEIQKQTFKKPLRVHIKIDSGMNRHGFDESEIHKVITTIKKLKGKMEVVGLYTHFAAAKNPSFPSDTKKQIAVFENWRNAFLTAGLTPICHASATAGTILYPEAQYDMVRIGIGLYGLWPSREAEGYMTGKKTLQPVLTWKTVVAEINNVRVGEKVGYDFTETITRPTKLAILPIGYWHGYPRALSSIGVVCIKGKRAKIIGRVCMDIIMIDVTDIPGVKVGDEVTLLGGDIDVMDVADHLGVSWYELVTRINPLIKRILT